MLSSVKWLRVLIILMITITLAPNFAQADVSTNDLNNLFARLDTRNGGNWYKDYNNEKYGELAWDESYVMRAYLEMYEATGNTKYLDKFVVHANSVLAQRDSVRGVKDYRGLSLPAWSAGDRYTKNGTRKIFEVHTAMITYPYARFVTIVNQNPALESYKSNANLYLKAVKDAIAIHDSEWIETSTEMYMNRPYNMFLAVGQVFLELYRATGEEQYRDKAVKIANHFKKNLQLDTGSNSYYWRYMRSGSYTGYEDLVHGAIDTDFAYLAYKCGVVFNETDMKRFGNTIEKKMIKPDGSIADKVTGAGTSKTQSFIGLYLSFYPWSPSLFDSAYKKVSAVTAPQGEDLLSAGYLNKVFAEKNGVIIPQPKPEPPVEEPGDNGDAIAGEFLKNGDFSAGKTGWSGPAVTVKSEGNGNKYASNTYNWDFFQDVKLAPGDYRLTALTRKGTSGTEARMAVVFIDAGGKRTVGYANSYKHKSTGWEPMPEKYITVPASAVTTRIYLLTNGGSGYHDFDNISLVKKTLEENKPIDNGVSLISNGDFSAGKTGWSGPAVTVKSEGNGNKYASNTYNWDFFQDVKLAPGDYRLTALTRKGTSGTEARMAVVFIDAGGKRTVGYANSYKHKSTGWEPMPEKYITVPSSAVTTRIYLLTNGGSGYHDFDNISLVNKTSEENKPIDNGVSLISNGDFSADKTGWSGPAVTVKSEGNGNKYASNTYNWDFFQDVKLAPGDYRLTALTRKGTSGTEARMAVVFIDAGGKRTVGYANSYKHKSTGWESMPEKNITVPGSAVTTRIYLLTNGGSGYHDFDNIGLYPL